MDCGNRAKKDCGYMRCRACCKNSGFDCVTHVKSTWIPAAKRQERRVEVAGSGGAAGGSSGSSSGGGGKRPRVVKSQNATTTTTYNANTLDMSPAHQDTTFKRKLPRTVRAPAIFRFTRVTAVDDGENEVGYQAIVHIGGHVFKGFLYDQGINE